MRAIYAALALPLLFRLLRARRGPTREQLLPPNEERVVLLGASSGVGKELALAYAARGAKICLVARRADVLAKVRDECVAQGLNPAYVISVSADITRASDLVKVREEVVKAWDGFDTLHILAGVPSTRTLLNLTGVSLVADPNDDSAKPRLVPKSEIGDLRASAIPTVEGLEALAVEARAASEINFVGTVLALTAFLPLLASSSRLPAVHHLSSVAATIAAPSRSLYSATKGAALAAVEAARIECEGMGVRFFCLLPGTIDNDFRTKTATSREGGTCEVHSGVEAAWGEKLLLRQDTVVETILEQLALPPQPYPIIPYPPFSWISALDCPPASKMWLPWQYKLGTLLNYTPAGYLYVEPNAREKYGLRK